jgi:uncharacterized protein (DUF433 family)/predicted RNA-binding protein with PUA-like domain
MAYWIFKYKPKDVRFENLFDTLGAFPTIDWKVPQHTEEIGSGDIAFLWRTGHTRGIVGVMRVEKVEEREEAEDLAIYVDPNSEEAKRIIRKQPRAVGTLILRGLDLRMAELRTKPGLENLSAFKPTIGTVFPVTEEEGAILAQLAGVPPLRMDEGGAVRVGNTRISLDVIVEQYENGMAPEDMVRAYDTLVLADLYSVIAYYLRHRGEVRAYLMRRAEEAEALRAKIEEERPRISREELLARRRAREKAEALAGR